MTRPLLYFCDHYEIPLPPEHRFPITKYRLLRDELSRDGVFDMQPAPLAASDTISLIHDPDYVRAFLDGTLHPQVIRRIGFPWSEGLVRRTLASVGGTVASARHALSNGWCGGLAGGTHHAFRDGGAGFCVFNDIAIAIAALRREGLVARCAVLDLDVHQGDGTAKIFENDADVLTVSVHGENNFPFRKQSSKLDVSLPDGAEDEQFLGALAQVLPRVREFGADILFYQSGVDGLATDALGRLNLTHECLKQRDEIVFSLCLELDLPCVVTLGGGYSRPVEPTVAAHATTFRTAARLFAPALMPRPQQAVY